MLSFLHLTQRAIAPFGAARRYITQRAIALVLKLLVPQRDGTYEVSLRYAAKVMYRRAALVLRYATIPYYVMYIGALL